VDDKLLLKFVCGALVLLAMFAVLTAWEVSQADQAQRALCVLKRDYQQRVNSTRRYEQMTPAERVKQYGPALGSVPHSVIASSLKSLEADVHSLRSLHC
jgi:hypothetical protein